MQQDSSWWPQAFGSEAIAGCGGAFKTEPEDFEVEEIPAYVPGGEGEHLYLWIQKRKLSTMDLMTHISRTFNVAQRDIGCAGMKDMFAVTRQYISVPARQVGESAVLNNDQVTVLQSARHANKLKTGHLRGNRFTLVLRGVDAQGLQRAQEVAAQISERGVPNFFGEQRLGRGGETVQLGLDILRGGTPSALKRPGSHRLRRLALSAVQSALFNQYLNKRIEDGMWRKILDGEVLQVCASGGPFVTDDVAREQGRYEAREVVPAGPIFGPKMRAATGEALAREAALLESSGCDISAFAKEGKLMQGTRRPLVVWPEDMRVAAHEHGIELKFTLPPGAYATVVLREFSRVAA